MDTRPFLIIYTPEECLASDHKSQLFSPAWQNALASLKTQITELWKLRTVNPDDTADLQKTIDDYIKEERYRVVYIPGQPDRFYAVLNEDDFREVLYSRTFPLISDEDIALLKSKTVLFLGCSTNVPVAMGLLAQGLGGFVLCDFDTIELSNTNRIPGTGVDRIGRLKTDHLRELILNTNPYAHVSCYDKPMTMSTLEQLVSEADLIFEMTDDPLVKLTARRAASQFDKPLCMITGIGDQPIVTAELPGDTPFHRNLTDEELAQFADRSLDLKSRFKLYVRIIGVENLPVESMLNMILAARGKRRYIAQHGGTALTAGGAGAYIARELLCGRQVKREVPLDLRALLSEPESVNQARQQLLRRMNVLYPDLFTEGDASLSDGVKRLARETFDLDY